MREASPQPPTLETVKSISAPQPAAGQIFKLEIFLVPPKGVYARPTGLTVSALTNERRRDQVDEALKSFINLVAPDRDILISATKPSQVTVKAPYFEMELRIMKDPGQTSVACTVGFYPPPPKCAVLDAVVSGALELGRVIHPGQDVFTLACLGDDSMGDRYFSGNLYYEAAANKIVPTASRHGGSRDQTNHDRYIRVISKVPYATKDRLGKFFYAIDVVYAKAPSPNTAAKDLLNELVVLAKTVDGDITAYAYVGNATKDPPWEQVIDAEDTFKRNVFAEYSAATTTITSRGTKVKMEDYKP